MTEGFAAQGAKVAFIDIATEEGQADIRALAAGAIFTVPAFVIVGAWDDIEIFSPNWFLATALLAVGGGTLHGKLLPDGKPLPSGMTT